MRPIAYAAAFVNRIAVRDAHSRVWEHRESCEWWIGRRRSIRDEDVHLQRECLRPCIVLRVGGGRGELIRASCGCVPGDYAGTGVKRNARREPSRDAPRDRTYGAALVNLIAVSEAHSRGWGRRVDGEWRSPGRLSVRDEDVHYQRERLRPNVAFGVLRLR